jgi:hypothetical protein
MSRPICPSRISSLTASGRVEIGALDGGARNDAGVPDQPIRLACRLDLRPLQAGKSNSSSNGSISTFGEFYGTSDNAVKTQIWIAVSLYLLVAIIKKRLALEAPLYTLLQVFFVTLFERMPMPQALSETGTTFEEDESSNQWNLFDF